MLGQRSAQGSLGMRDLFHIKYRQAVVVLLAGSQKRNEWIAALDWIRELS